MAASHIWAVRSLLAVTTRPPSELNAALFTVSWWTSLTTETPMPACQTRTIRSLLAVTRSAPSGLNAAVFTEC